MVLKSQLGPQKFCIVPMEDGFSFFSLGIWSKYGGKIYRRHAKEYEQPNPRTRIMSSNLKHDPNYQKEELFL